MKNDKPEVIEMPVLVSRVWIVHDVCVTSSKPPPSKWVQFWHRHLLGWRWELIDNE